MHVLAMALRMMCIETIIFVSVHEIKGKLEIASPALRALLYVYTEIYSLRT